jgi:hypothetical protein
MNSKIDITEYLTASSWRRLVQLYTPSKLAQLLSFKDALCAAYRMLCNEDWDEDLQEYAISFLYEIRRVYSNEWDSCWQYDALIGYACTIRYRHEERYEAYKRAFDRAVEPPPGLLIEFARCSICPGSPPIPYDQAIGLVMRALQSGPYADAIGLLCNLYSFKWDTQMEEYWRKVLEKSDHSLRSPSIIPQFIEDNYLESRAKREKIQSSE